MRHAIGPVTQTSPLIHDQIPEEESYDEDPDEHPGESKITISIEWWLNYFTTVLFIKIRSNKLLGELTSAYLSPGHSGIDGSPTKIIQNINSPQSDQYVAVYLNRILVYGISILGPLHSDVVRRLEEST